MKRLLSFLIVAALVLFAVFKAGVWWLTDQRMAEARRSLSEYGVLERGTIHSSVDGRVTLKNALWQDFRLTPPLDIGTLEFDAGSPVSLISALADPSHLPETWRVSATDLRLTLEPAMFRNWVDAGDPSDEASAPLVVLPCGPDLRQRLGSGDLIRMGITDLTGDFAVTQSSTGLIAEINTGTTGSLELHWPDTRVGPQTLDTLWSEDAPALNIQLRDAGLMRRLSGYCARETGLSLDDWGDQALEFLTQALAARGYRGSPQLMALYRTWLMDGGELTLQLASGADLPGVPVRADEDASDSWPIRYNGAEVPDVYLMPLEEPAQPAATTSAALPEEGVQAQPEGRQWYPEAVENAGDWINRQVRVELSNGNEVEGRLVSVGERELEVARTVAGGEVAYPILIRAITRFEVWRRGQQN